MESSFNLQERKKKQEGKKKKKVILKDKIVFSSLFPNAPLDYLEQI